MEKLKNIQALRAIAALLVLGAHIKFPIRATRWNLPEQTLPTWSQDMTGGIGVDIFFVISGYVICLTAASRGQDAWHFLRNRFARIAPLHYFLTLVILARLWWRPQAVDATPGFHSLWNSFFFLPVFDMDRLTLPVNFFAWSLCFEMWFYLLFALLLLAVPPRKAALGLPMVLLPGVLLSVFYSGAWYLPRFLFDPMALEFAIGCLLFAGQRFLNVPVSWLCVSGALLLFFLVVPRHEALGWYPPRGETAWDVPAGGRDYYAFQRLLIFGIPAGLLVTGLVGLEKHAAFVLPWPLIALGDVSYSLYLLQPITIWLAHGFALIVRTTDPVAPALAYIVFTIGGAFLSWHFIEKPLTHLARRWLGIKPRESLAGETTLAPKRGSGK